MLISLMAMNPRGCEPSAATVEAAPVHGEGYDRHDRENLKYL